MSRNGSRSRHATLFDFRDLDLMLKLRAEAGAEGWVETDAMASALGFDDDRLPIAQRLSWMRRYGMVEYDRERRLWRLSPGGERVTEARLQAAASHTIEVLEDEVMVEVMAKVTQRYMHGSPMLATMLRREFLYGTRPR
jgi:hypothetical protein